MLVKREYSTISAVTLKLEDTIVIMTQIGFLFNNQHYKSKLKFLNKWVIYKALFDKFKTSFFLEIWKKFSSWSLVSRDQ